MLWGAIASHGWTVARSAIVSAIRGIVRHTYLRMNQCAQKNSLLYHRGDRQSHTKPRTATLERLGLAVTGEQKKNGVWHNAPPAGRAPTSPDDMPSSSPALWTALMG
jgi:hypothetical protein